MNQIIETRMSNCETALSKLAQAEELTQGVLKEIAPLVQGIAPIIKNEVAKQLKDEAVFNQEKLKSDVIANVSAGVDEKVRAAVLGRGLSKRETNILTKERNRKVGKLLGSQECDKYILYSKFYFGAISKAFKKHFDVYAYSDIDMTQLNEAVNFVKCFDMSDSYVDWVKKTVHKQYIENELPPRIKNAYERFFGIRG